VLNIPVALVFVCRKNFESIILSVQVLLVQCSGSDNLNTTTKKKHENDTLQAVSPPMSNVRDWILPFSFATNQPNY